MNVSGSSIAEKSVSVLIVVHLERDICNVQLPRRVHCILVRFDELDNLIDVVINYFQVLYIGFVFLHVGQKVDDVANALKVPAQYYYLPRQVVKVFQYLS